MIRLTKKQVLYLHRELIRETGGAEGLRDEGLLDSALNSPFQSFGGVDAYPSIQQKGASLGFGLIKNHAFVDGNKRIGAHAMLVFSFAERYRPQLYPERTVRCGAQSCLGRAYI